MKNLRILLSGKKGTAHAVSAVLITATILVLVLVTSMYAYQILEQQRATADFEVAKESFLAFNDALENVARTGREAGRSVRFTTEYGHLLLQPDAETLNVTAMVDQSNIILYEGSSGSIEYYMKTDYVNFGEGYESYILGDQRVVVNTTESFGRAVVKQQSGWARITLNYRVRAMKTSTLNVMEGDPPEEVRANVVDIWIIKVNIGRWSTYTHNFDLKAKCINVETISTLYDVGSSIDNCTIDVVLKGSGVESDSVFIQLESAEKILFNVIITEVLVTV